MKPIIPEAALQQHVAVLGKTRSGKSSVLRGLVEGLLDRELPVCIVDPKGDWWGIKLSKDGKRPGYPVVIFGGEHADVPINQHAGGHVAELFATGNRPCLIDLGGWMVSERTRFYVDFASTLFRLTKGMRYLCIDEIHNFAPKGKVMDPDAGKALHWTNRLASEGLGKGLPILFASQRPQKVHNDTLTSAETLIAMRVLHPSDRGAVSDWIKGCGDLELGAKVLASLAQMDRGEGWVWSPEIGLGPERVRFPMFKTYDSFRPQTAEDTAGLKGWASVDLDDVKAKLSKVVQEAEANDPKLLRVRISDLERELKKGHAPASDQVAIAAARQEGREEGARDGYAAGLRAVQPIADRLGTLGLAVTETIDGFQQDLRRLTASAPKAAPQAGSAHPRSGSRVSPAVAASSGGDSQVDKPMPRAMLTALAQHPEGLTKGQILVHTGYRSSGPVSGCFADLARNSWTEMAQGRLRITTAGLAALGAYDPLPTGAALREHLLNGSKCSTMEKAMLRVLFGAYPEVIAKGKILEVTGYASSGPVSGAFARLVALGYAKPAGRGALVAAAELFNG